MKEILPEKTKLWIQEVSGNLHFVWYVGYACTIELQKQSDIYYKLIALVIKDENIKYAYDEEDIFRVGKEIVEKQMKDPAYTNSCINKWEKIVKEYYSICKIIDVTDLKKLNDKEFKNLYNKFCQSYIKEYALPMLADALGYYSEIRIQELLRKYLKSKKDEKSFTTFLTLLTTPTEESFLSKERTELLKIASEFVKGKAIKRALKQHAAKWFWIQNNYSRSLMLDEKYFFDRIKEHTKTKDPLAELKKLKKSEKESIKQKEELVRAHQFGKEMNVMVQLLDRFTTWQDMRKKANLIAQHYLTILLKEVKRRKKIPVELLTFTTMDEMLDLLSGKEIDKGILKKRQKVVGVVYYANKTVLCDDKQSQQLYKEVNKRYSQNGADELFGTVANVGKIQGKARIIMGPKEFNKLKKGDILVTSMTRPEFMPILKKAAAIVTDEGGLTCHAAIVSREFGIPCIVGTKVATKTLKDGEVIEVNANHGFLRKIN